MKHRLSVLMVVCVCLIYSTQSLGADLQSPTVEFIQSIHFLTSAGDDVEVGPGTYHLQQAESWFKLVPDGDGPASALLLDATLGTHEEKLADSLVRLERELDNPDVFHLGLLLPNGTGLEAVGSVSGVRPRGFQLVFLNKTKLQKAAKRNPSAGAGGNTIFPTLITNKPGYVTKIDSEWTDRCVPNVEHQITKTLHNGKDNRDLLAYRSGGNGSPSLENKGLHKAGRTGRNSWKHRQGIARYFSESRNYFYVSDSVTPAWTRAGKIWRSGSGPMGKKPERRTIGFQYWK